MESFGIPQNELNLTTQFSNFPSPNKLHTFSSAQDFIRSETLGLSSQRVDLLLEKLMEYDKLEEFLDLVVRQTDCSISVVLVELAEKIVQRY